MLGRHCLEVPEQPGLLRCFCLWPQAGASQPGVLIGGRFPGSSELLSGGGKQRCSAGCETDTCVHPWGGAHLETKQAIIQCPARRQEQ